MSKKKKTYLKEDPITGIEFPAWRREALDEYPITNIHVGKPISLAEDPKSKRYDLVKIYTPGQKLYPDGGYKITDPDLKNGRSIYPEEARAFPPPKMKSNSQLALKNKTKRKAKRKTKKKKSSK
jgi:hypothetical protein